MYTLNANDNGIINLPKEIAGNFSEVYFIDESDKDSFKISFTEPSNKKYIKRKKTSVGQVTIPANIRKNLNITVKSTLIMSEERYDTVRSNYASDPVHVITVSNPIEFDNVDELIHYIDKLGSKFINSEILEQALLGHEKDLQYIKTKIVEQMDNLKDKSFDDQEIKNIEEYILIKSFPAIYATQFILDDNVQEITINDSVLYIINRSNSLTKITDNLDVKKVIHLLSKHFYYRDGILDFVDKNKRIFSLLKSGNEIFFTVRKQLSNNIESLTNLLELEVINENQVEILKKAFEHNLNILVIGTTGTGKTTIIKALTNNIPVDKRIVTIEKATELQLLNKRSNHIAFNTESSFFEDNNREKITNALSLLEADYYISTDINSKKESNIFYELSLRGSNIICELFASDPESGLTRFISNIIKNKENITYQEMQGIIGKNIDIIIETKRDIQNKYTVEIYVVLTESFKNQKTGVSIINIKSSSSEYFKQKLQQKNTIEI